MDDKHKVNLSFFLALASLAVSASFFLLCVKPLLDKGFPVYTPFEKVYSFSGRLFLAGWFPGFILAISSISLLRRSKERHRTISIWILSVSVIILSLLWASLSFAMIIDRIGG
jgi:uncharacterized membrane protein